jgi:hypothetical protein
MKKNWESIIKKFIIKSSFGQVLAKFGNDLICRSINMLYIKVKIDLLNFNLLLSKTCRADKITHNM